MPAQAEDDPHKGLVKLYAPYNRTYAPIEPLRIGASLDIRYGPHDEYTANYTLDDGAPQKIPKESLKPEFWSVTYGAVYVSAELPKLPVGQHKLTIYISVNYSNTKTPWFVSGEKTVYFTVSAIGTDDAAITGGEVHIYSPANKSYSAKSIIPIEASASTVAVKTLTYTATYFVDGKGPYKLRANPSQFYEYDLFFGSGSAAGELYLLPEGKHNVTVCIEAYNLGNKNVNVTGVATVYFGVGDINPPNITLCDLDDEMFNEGTIPLNFTLNESASWIAYSLDNGIQTPITANITLTASNGNHTLIVYANDTAGNLGQSEEAHFLVQSEGSMLQPANVEVIVTAVLAAFVIVVALAAIYQKKQLKK